MGRLTTQETPPYEFFTSSPNTIGSMADFVRNLEPGIPKELDRPFTRSGQNTIYSAAKRLGFKVAIREIDGKVWVCRLKDEDTGFNRRLKAV